ncbi:MAG: AmmeMemoRadiSam system radical SAM enzyme [bacterium]|nr:AmmeMemoRadiSam system radical SAM enzyme [bacterium]
MTPTVAQYWHRTTGNYVQCTLCPHHCTIAPGHRGLCGVRENRDGTLISLNFSVACSLNLDPIEKKPLHHFFPGSRIISVGTYGCNLACPWCQNFTISKEFSPHSLRPNLSPDLLLRELDKLARRDLHEMCGVSYTYNEPTVWFEFIMACAPRVRERGLKNVLVTNGYISPEPLNDLLKFVDALNIDLKSFDDEFYRRYCRGELAHVLSTIRTAARYAHVELTTLVIPTLNDDPALFTAMQEWILAHLGPDVPVHLSRYMPMYKCELPPTPLATLERAAHILREKLHYVYLGNVSSPQNTLCRTCGACLVQRHGYDVSLLALNAQGSCSKCGTPAPIVMR